MVNNKNVLKYLHKNCVFILYNWNYYLQSMWQKLLNFKINLLSFDIFRIGNFIFLPVGSLITGMLSCFNESCIYKKCAMPQIINNFNIDLEKLKIYFLLFTPFVLNKNIFIKTIKNLHYQKNTVPL
jgi:hypothetical protein